LGYGKSGTVTKLVWVMIFAKDFFEKSRDKYRGGCVLKEYELCFIVLGEKK
jgi:hypothetical protein